jgi:hypothetical protein
VLEVVLDVVASELVLVAVEVVTAELVDAVVATVVPPPPPGGGSRWRMKLTVNGNAVTCVPTASPFVLDRKERAFRPPPTVIAGVNDVTVHVVPS